MRSLTFFRRTTSLVSLGILLLGGCNRFRHLTHEMVYVSAQQTYLHDRVAAVSNRVAEVTNGQQLEVLEHDRRFLKVKTQKNEIGWIEEHAVIDSKAYDAFAQLADQHRGNLVVATAVLRDDTYLHVSPGAKSDRFYLLAAAAKVQLLARTTLARNAAPNPVPATKLLKPSQSPPIAPSSPKASGSKGTVQGASGAATPEDTAPAAPIIDDWWLVRDGQGHTGWVLSNRMDVDVPDEIGLYAEGQRIVGAYVLTKVMDPDASTPNHEVPEYVTILSPPKSGQPFDFDQVRVFTWSLKRHRYETAFRLHPIQGFLPVQVGNLPSPGGSLPSFSFQIGNGALLTDTATGIARPASPRTIQYSLNDTAVKRIGPDMAPLPTSHSADQPRTPGKAAKSKVAKKKGRAG